MDLAMASRARRLPRRLLVEPRRPARVRTSPSAAWYVVAAVSVGAFMGQLDASIALVALPRISSDFGASVSSAQWVSLSYLLVLACTLVPIGHLADRWGRKLLYMYGFAVFTAASAVCALAPTLGWLIAARVVQALGAAMLQANSVALIREALPNRSLGRGIGLQGAAQALGLAAGPAIGGVVLALGGWRLLFLVNLPAGCLGITLGWLLLPRSGSDRRPRRLPGSDRVGALLLAASVGCVMLALSFAASDRVAIVAGLAAGALVAGSAFVRRETRAAAPLLDLALLRRPALATGLSSGLISYAALFGTLFVVPFDLVARHVSPVATGAQLAALPIALGLVAPLAGRLSDARGPRSVSALGLLVAAAGLIVVAMAAGVPLRVAGLALAGAGFGAFTPANNAAVMGAAPDGRAGVVGGTLNLVRALGTALGIAVTSLLYATGGATAARALAIPLTGWAVAMGVTGLWLLRRRAHDGVGRRARIGGAA